MALAFLQGGESPERPALQDRDSRATAPRARALDVPGASSDPKSSRQCIGAGGEVAGDVQQPDRLRTGRRLFRSFKGLALRCGAHLLQHASGGQAKGGGIRWVVRVARCAEGRVTPSRGCERRKSCVARRFCGGREIFQPRFLGDLEAL